MIHIQDVVKRLIQKADTLQEHNDYHVAELATKTKMVCKSKFKKKPKKKDSAISFCRWLSRQKRYIEWFDDDGYTTLEPPNKLLRIWRTRK